MPDLVEQLPLHIDSTMVSCFRQCPRRFYQEFILGLRPAAVSVDLHAGACFASSLERFYKGVYSEQLDTQKATSRALGTFMKEWGEFVPMKETPKSKERVWDAIEAYISQWPPLTDTVQPYRDPVTAQPSYEFTFGIPLGPCPEMAPPRGLDHSVYDSYEPADHPGEFPLHPDGSPFIYAGRFDMLGSRYGKTVWRDEKTTTSIGSSWAEQWDLRSQFLGYTWALQQSGIPCDGGVVRGIGILKTKITLVEAYKTYTNELIARWYEQLRRDLWRLRRMWDEKYWDYNLADACTSYGGCSFRLPCSSPDPSRWYAGYEVRRWNPTQKNPIAEPKAVAA